jgi:hypothetical protein
VALQPRDVLALSISAGLRRTYSVLSSFSLALRFCNFPPLTISNVLVSAFSCRQISETDWAVTGLAGGREITLHIRIARHFFLVDILP